MKKITVIGGGLSGLVAAIRLVRAQIPVRLFEKNYPFHRVCGEYISNETIPYLKSLNLYPEELSPNIISSLQLTSVNGKSANLPLDMGGFGISRYRYDHWLYKIAEREGVEVHQNTEVTGVTFQDGQFELFAHHKVYGSSLVIGAFGKRSKMDVKMKILYGKKVPLPGR